MKNTLPTFGAVQAACFAKTRGAAGFHRPILFIRQIMRQGVYYFYYALHPILPGCWRIYYVFYLEPPESFYLLEFPDIC